MTTTILACEKFKVGNIYWEGIIIKRADHKKYINEIIVDFNCLYEDRSLSNLWSINTEIEIHSKIKNTEIRKKLCHRFDSSSTSMSFGKFIDYSFFEKLPKFRKIRASIDIKSARGVRVYEPTDFKTPKYIDSEVVLLHGDQKLYVDRYALICISPIFRKMLPDGMHKKELNVFKHISYKHFIDFLRILYRWRQDVTSENVDGLIAIAKRYEIQFLMSECEDFLISTESLAPIQKLHVAEFFEASGELQTKVLEKMSKAEINEMEKENFEIMLETTAKAVFSASVGNVELEKKRRGTKRMIGGMRDKKND